LRDKSACFLRKAISKLFGDEHTMTGDDYDDPKVESDWLVKQRLTVEKYLQDQGIRHRGVSPEPKWFLAPYVAIWTVESLKTPGAVGWWAISGDLPTDYLSGNDASDAREAMTAFAHLWRETADCMLRGEEHPTLKIGPPAMRRELGDLLRRRAEILRDWIDDDEMWHEDL